jgi:hypothetical protein
MLAEKIHCALGLIFFHSVIYKRKCAYLSFENSTTTQLASAQRSLFLHWPMENEEMEAFC